VSERDCYQDAVSQENRQLSTAIKEADVELVDIEGMLGVTRKVGGAKNPPHSDVSGRLDELISCVTYLGRRLSVVKKAVLGPKEAVG